MLTTHQALSEDLAAKDLAHVVHPLARPQQLAALGPVVAVSAQGAEVVLSDGRTMIDGPAAMWCVNVGHGRRELIEAATRSWRRWRSARCSEGAHPRPPSRSPKSWRSEPLATSITSSSKRRTRPTRRPSNSPDYWHLQGRSSKVAILSHDPGYRGVTGLTTFATGQEPYHVGRLRPPGIHHFPTPYESRQFPAEFEETISGHAPGETHRGDRRGQHRRRHHRARPRQRRGSRAASGYQRRLREVCDENDILLIADEIITGFGRTGTWFASERDGVVPNFLAQCQGHLQQLLKKV